MEESKPVEYLIVDSSAFIKQAPLKDITNHVYTVDAVVNEIRDSNTKRSLQVLPYTLTFKQANAESLKYVSDFAKKTGDYTTLSAVDLQLIALSYQLCKEQNDFRQLLKDNVVQMEQIKLDKQINIAGFYQPSTKDNQNEEKKENDNDKQNENQDENKNEKINDEVNQVNNENAKNSESDKNDNQVDGEQENDENDDDENADDDDDDDGEGWICPSNIKEKLSDLEQMECNLLDKKLKVACMTSDFSMQNVLLQMGISVVSVDGLLIKKIRNYVLRCITCMKITTDLSKQFCPKCGYKSLERIVETIDCNGNKMYIGRKKPRSTKGLRHPLPLPKGGKHSNNPILSEDQPRPQNKPSKKAFIKTNALDSDYICQSSPFAVRDVYSRAANLGIKAGGTKKNNRK